MKTVVFFLILSLLTACDPLGIKEYNNQVANNYYPSCVRSTGNEAKCRQQVQGMLITSKDVFKGPTTLLCYSAYCSTW